MLRRSAVTRSTNKLYELRWYDIKPKYVPRYLELTAQKMHLRTAISPLMGFWMTEIGGQNQVVHIWEYDSLTQRKEVRTAVGANTEWQTEYFSEARTLFAAQSNVLMRANQEVVTGPPKTAGPQYYFLEVGAREDPPLRYDSDKAESLGNWSIICGQNGVKKKANQVGLLRSNNLDALLEASASRAGAIGHTRILMPLPSMQPCIRDWK